MGACQIFSMCLKRTPRISRQIKCLYGKRNAVGHVYFSQNSQKSPVQHNEAGRNRKGFIGWKWNNCSFYDFRNIFLHGPLKQTFYCTLWQSNAWHYLHKKNKKSLFPKDVRLLIPELGLCAIKMHLWKSYPWVVVNNFRGPHVPRTVASKSPLCMNRHNTTFSVTGFEVKSHNFGSLLFTCNLDENLQSSGFRILQRNAFICFPFRIFYQRRIYSGILQVFIFSTFI